MSNATVGKVSSDLMQKQPDTTSPIEIQKSSENDYIHNLFMAVNAGKKKYPKDFFVVVDTKQEKLLHNVLRNYFYSRKTCPTPNYDQAVFKYTHAKEELEFVWVIPSRDACFHLKQNIDRVVKDEHELLRFVVDYDNGTLFKLCKKLNSERDDSSLIQS